MGKVQESPKFLTSIVNRFLKYLAKIQDIYMANVVAYVVTWALALPLVPPVSPHDAPLNFLGRKKLLQPPGADDSIDKGSHYQGQHYERNRKLTEKCQR